MAGHLKAIFFPENLQALNQAQVLQFAQNIRRSDQSLLVRAQRVLRPAAQFAALVAVAVLVEPLDCCGDHTGPEAGLPSDALPTVDDHSETCERPVAKCDQQEHLSLSEVGSLQLLWQQYVQFLHRSVPFWTGEHLMTKM